MKNEKEVLKKLLKIAIKQQQIIHKLATHGPRKAPGTALKKWEKLGLTEEEWDALLERLQEQKRLEDVYVSETHKGEEARKAREQEGLGSDLKDYDFGKPLDFDF